MKDSFYRKWIKVCALAGALTTMSGIGATAPAWAQAGLQGPRYHADMRLSDANGTMPTGGAVFTQRMEVDTGSPVTILTRAAATSFGMLMANGADNGYRAANIQIGGVGGGGVAAQYSIQLSILAKGKLANGMDAEPNFTQVNNLRVVYPRMGQGDLNLLLGTNYIAGLAGGARFVANPDGSCTFAAPPAPPPGPVRRTGLQLRGLQPPADGFGDQFLVPGLQVNALKAMDFVLVTGSPYTIVSTKTAAALKLSPMGIYDLYNGDPETFAALVSDGFFDNYNPGPFSVAMVSQLTIPTDDGSGITYTNVPVLINPFASADNVLGTNLLNPGNTPTEVNLAYGYLQYGVYSAPPPPTEPPIKP
jgi:hypothetical protein